MNKMKKIITGMIVVGLIAPSGMTIVHAADKEPSDVGDTIGLTAGVTAGVGFDAAVLAGYFLGATFASGGLVLLASGALLALGYGFYYAAEKDKNYQAFVNNAYQPVTINIDYHVCKVDDTFNLDHGQNAVYYPKACQPKTITIYAKGTNKVLGQRSFNVGDDGGRHGNWVLVKGAAGDSVVVKEREMKSRIAYMQWVGNSLNQPIHVTLVYHGQTAISCRKDIFDVQPGGNYSVKPGGCLLNKIFIDSQGKQSISREFRLSAPGTAHGSWNIVPDGNGMRIDGPLD